MKDDYLYGTPWHIHQEEGMYHFNSDTEFLGRMLQIKKGMRVLDVGTNNGALLLYAAMHTDNLTGIDLFPEIIALARNNLQANGLNAQLTVSPLQTYQDDPFDAIICNPPYFVTGKESLKNENPYLRAARHEEFLTMKELFAHSARLLKKDGTLQIVHRADRLAQLLETAEHSGLYPYWYKLAYKNENMIPQSVAVCFGRYHYACHVYAPAYMNQRDSFALYSEEVPWKPF
ncbi:MAG: methyltransferase [Lactimicrobium sp.]|jgi:tRNA1Val (adenine37-N6)-methyltransferase|uniref:tRNA1(Val) (adenine(37)-N6)-methyltransferase n=2 Tax=Lactimicrobium sp. TaxID=2563780 RepID=UPI002F350A2C